MTARKTGWSGGAANRTWQRGSRSSDSGLVEDVQRLLAQFRAEHGWEPEMVWDPYTAAYIRPEEAR